MRSAALLLLLSCTPILAQKYTAQHIKFSQLGPFTQKQLEDASGFHPGITFTTAELTAAAQRLSDSGYFDDVAAGFGGTTAQFDIKPVDPAKLLPVAFENFVFLTHDEIETAIHSKFPLFLDALPENSGLQQDIADALTATLAAKSIAATVAFDTYEPTLHHPHREIGFRITKPTVRVANIKLGGVTPALAPLLQKSVNSTARTRYTEGPADQTTTERILAPIVDAGYLKAALTGVTVTPSPAENGVVPVVLSAGLDAGEIYHLSAITFAGTALLSAEAFAASAKLHPGDLASRAALIETLQPLDAAYRRQGYMDVVVQAKPAFDESNHQVAYIVKVEPGEQYRIHRVTANNLDPAAQVDFDKHFLLKTGELYNPEYAAGFIKNNTALFSLRDYTASFKAIADPNTHTVNLIINFLRAPR